MKDVKVSSGDRKVPSSIINVHDKRIASSIASIATDANIVVYKNAWPLACPEMVNNIFTPVFFFFFFCRNNPEVCVLTTCVCCCRKKKKGGYYRARGLEVSRVK